MKVFEYLDRIILMNKMVKRGSTGTPEEFAQQLGVSRTSLYELIYELRLRGAPIKYSKSAKTFYYTEPFEISVTCSLRPLEYQEEKNYSGGNILSKILFSRTIDFEISNH
jgi:predicted DNA-binding transcriptional regulator YafY